jgi:AraC-like DNA-binding protein
MSRSAFAERFAALVGRSPMEFLAEWRMQLARRWLEQDRLSVALVAERCGYQSETAFRKAFKRITGVGPGELRRGRTEK